MKRHFMIVLFLWLTVGGSTLLPAQEPTKDNEADDRAAIHPETVR